MSNRLTAEEVPGSLPIGGGGERVLPYKSLTGMMESHFHDWTDYNGVAFSIEFNTSTHFRIFRGKTVLHIYG